MNRRNAIQKATLLLGGVFSAPTLLAMNQWEQKTMLLGTTFSLSDIQRKIVAEVAEMIIPKTNTAGAIDAGVPAFIEIMMKDCYKQPEHLSFIEGISALEQDKFLEMNVMARTERLKKLEAEAKETMKARQVKQIKMGDNVDKEAMKATAKGLPFWRLMKELTLLGYFTSEIGTKSSFEYVPIPSKFEAIKLKPNQKAYSY